MAAPTVPIRVDHELTPLGRDLYGLLSAQLKVPSYELIATCPAFAVLERSNIQGDERESCVQ